VSGYHLSKPAEDDLRGIFLYTLETWGEEQVPVYLNLVETALQRIAENPMTFGSKTRDYVVPGCRTFRSGKHIIVYRINGGIVEIARILHESMDSEQHVGDRDFES
jgi:toxin ParE1/3/4